MKYLVTGGNGQLGQELYHFLKDDTVLALDKDALDITDAEKVMQFISEEKFDCVFHCAAYTQVDLAEQNRDVCFEVNVIGTKNIAEACKKNNIKLIYLSTDYVFNGEGTNAFEVNDLPDPLNYYGETKKVGEDYVKTVEKYFIVRISWVFGLYGNNFVETMLKLAETRKELKVVDDQIGSPTFTYDLAKLLKEMTMSEKYGIYHATNEGTCSWAQFARYIFEVAQKNVNVISCSSDEYPTIAKRPKNSRLSKKSLDSAGFSRLPTWKDAVKRYIDWRK